jgi:hypothetical protein
MVVSSRFGTCCVLGRRMCATAGQYPACRRIAADSARSAQSADRLANIKNDGRAWAALPLIGRYHADRLGADPKKNRGNAASADELHHRCCSDDDGDDARGHAQKRNAGRARFECVTSCVSKGYATGYLLIVMAETMVRPEYEVNRDFIQNSGGNPPHKQARRGLVAFQTRE